VPKIIFISDTHGLHDRMAPLPEGEILIHAGDLTNIGSPNEVAEAGVWLRKMKERFQHVICVAGNHDWLFEKNPMLAVSLLHTGTNLAGDGGLIYLQDSGVTVGGLSVYGSPQTPFFYNWAFNVERGHLKPYWDRIPEGLDILVTHGPPMGIRDQAAPHLGSEHAGDQELLEAVERVKPKIHVFGHFHGSYGISKYENTTFINASICDEAYRPINSPIVIEV
jgi:Icc-related predicted phosphoesterase